MVTGNGMAAAPGGTPKQRGAEKRYPRGVWATIPEVRKGNKQIEIQHEGEWRDVR